MPPLKRPEKGPRKKTSATGRIRLSSNPRKLPNEWGGTRSPYSMQQTAGHGLGWLAFLPAPAAVTDSKPLQFWKNAAFFSMKSFFSSGTSSSAGIESEVHAGMHAPQSMHP